MVVVITPLQLILRYKDDELCEEVISLLSRLAVEFRRGTAGGGNPLRQPYLRPYRESSSLEEFPNVEHVHFYGFYLGNYPDLDENKIIRLCKALNKLS